MASPISRFSSSRTRWRRWEGMAGSVGKWSDGVMGCWSIGVLELWNPNTPILPHSIPRAVHCSDRSVSSCQGLPASADGWRSQLGGDLLGRVSLNDVARLEIVVTIDADAAFHAGPHFVDFVLEAAKRLD